MAFNFKGPSTGRSGPPQFGFGTRAPPSPGFSSSTSAKTSFSTKAGAKFGFGAAAPPAAPTPHMKYRERCCPSIERTLLVASAASMAKAFWNNTTKKHADPSSAVAAASDDDNDKSDFCIVKTEDEGEPTAGAFVPPPLLECIAKLLPCHMAHAIIDRTALRTPSFTFQALRPNLDVQTITGTRSKFFTQKELIEERDRIEEDARLNWHLLARSMSLSDFQSLLAFSSLSLLRHPLNHFVNCAVQVESADHFNAMVDHAKCRLHSAEDIKSFSTSLVRAMGFINADIVSSILNMFNDDELVVGSALDAFLFPGRSVLGGNKVAGKSGQHQQQGFNFGNQRLREGPPPHIDPAATFNFGGAAAPAAVAAQPGPALPSVFPSDNNQRAKIFQLLLSRIKLSDPIWPKLLRDLAELRRYNEICTVLSWATDTLRSTHTDSTAQRQRFVPLSVFRFLSIDKQDTEADPAKHASSFPAPAIFDDSDEFGPNSSPAKKDRLTDRVLKAFSLFREQAEPYGNKCTATTVKSENGDDSAVVKKKETEEQKPPLQPFGIPAPKPSPFAFVGASQSSTAADTPSNKQQQQSAPKEEGNSFPTMDKLRSTVASIFDELPPTELTKKVLRRRLEQAFNIDLSARGDLVNELIMEEMNKPSTKKKLADAEQQAAQEKFPNPAKSVFSAPPATGQKSVVGGPKPAFSDGASAFLASGGPKSAFSAPAPAAKSAFPAPAEAPKSAFSAPVPAAKSAFPAPAEAQGSTAFSPAKSGFSAPVQRSAFPSPSGSSSTGSTAFAKSTGGGTASAAFKGGSSSPFGGGGSSSNGGGGSAFGGGSSGGGGGGAFAFGGRR